MFSSYFHSTILVLVWLRSCVNPTLGASLAIRQADTSIPPYNYRRRGYHSSAILDGWVYIDGGEVSYDSGGSVTRQFCKCDDFPDDVWLVDHPPWKAIERWLTTEKADTLLAIDLSTNWTNNSVIIKPIAKPSGAPSLVSGGLWTAQNTLYTGFAGRRSRYNPSVRTPGRGLWSFKPNGMGNGTWKLITDSDNADWTSLVRPYSPLVASGNGMGYMLGGWQVNESSADSGDHQNPISGLLKYNFTSKSATNQSVAGVAMAGVNQMGGMQFVPNFGLQGLLVAIGGDQVGKIRPGADSFLNMNSIQIYDIATEKWYEQKTSGNPPDPRKEFCVAGLASPQKTYEILVYAGWGGNLGTDAIRFDTAHVLSLPTMRWFRADYEAMNPRHALSCNPVGGGQVLMIGGLNTTQNGPGDYYNAVFNTQDQLTQGLAIFNMSKLDWETSYVAKPPAYQQPLIIRDWYTNNARKPPFSDPNLAAVFAYENFTAVSDMPVSSTGSSQNSPSTNTGAIVGGVVGGIVGITVIATAVLLVLRRRRQDELSRSHVACNTTYHAQHMPEMDGNGVYKHELFADCTPEVAAEDRLRSPSTYTVSAGSMAAVKANQVTSEL